jgi:DNA-binding NarL/FixJ family response regulator
LEHVGPSCEHFSGWLRLQRERGNETVLQEAALPVFAPHLTAREREVMACAGCGMTNPQIASELSMSIHTVKSHFQHVYVKLGIHDRRAAVRHVMGVPTLPIRDEAPSFPPSVPLTPRQRQIVALMMVGMTRREVADALFVTLSTVKSHTTAAYKRLGVHFLADAAAVVASFACDVQAA